MVLLRGARRFSSEHGQWLRVCWRARRHAQTGADRGEIRGLKLGLNARSMALAASASLPAAATAGRRASRSTAGRRFAKCRAEDSGLYEVYARFDDEDEYIGRAIDDPMYARGKGNTAGRPPGDPVGCCSIATACCGPFASSPIRAPRPHERRMAHLLRLSVIARYGREGWTCRKSHRPRARPPSEGFSSSAVRKAQSERDLPGGALPAQARPGRPRPRGAGEYKAGQFEKGSGRRSSFEPAPSKQANCEQRIEKTRRAMLIRETWGTESIRRVIGQSQPSQ